MQSAPTLDPWKNRSLRLYMCRGEHSHWTYKYNHMRRIWQRGRQLIRLMTIGMQHTRRMEMLVASYVMD